MEKVCYLLNWNRQNQSKLFGKTDICIYSSKVIFLKSKVNQFIKPRNQGSTEAGGGLNLPVTAFQSFAAQMVHNLIPSPFLSRKGCKLLPQVFFLASLDPCRNHTQHLCCSATYVWEECYHAEKPACDIRHAQLTHAPNPAFLPQWVFQPNVFASKFPLSLLKSQLEEEKDWKEKVKHVWLTSMINI